LVWRLVAWLVALGFAALAAQSGSAQQVRVAFVATEANNQHKLVADRGSVYVTYTQPTSGVPQVHVAASPDGRRWHTVGQVSRGSGPSTLSTLVVDRANHIHIAWTQFDGSLGRVYYRKYDSGWREPELLSLPGAYAGYPSMDIDSRGRLHLVWYGIREASAGTSTAHGAIYEIYYVRYDRRWTAPEQISPGIPDAINPTLAVDASDRVHVVWFQSDGRAFQVVYTSRSASGAWTSPATLTGGEEPSTMPALAVDRNGRAHAVWERKGGIDYLEGAAGTWSAPLRLTENGSHPTVGLWSRGVFALWSGKDGAVWVRAFDGTWRDAQRLGPGDYPNATPWRPGGDGTPYAVSTAAGQFQVTALTPLLERK
jgi:hypothetical protein